jgi:mRNA-degrading endonuclease RelE of RelBE toxin-antitoxin system
MRGKTETIKQRALYIYLPSLDMAEEWKRLAEKDKTSISKFIIENVENSLPSSLKQELTT